MAADDKPVDIDISVSQADEPRTRSGHIEVTIEGNTGRLARKLKTAGAVLESDPGTSYIPITDELVEEMAEFGEPMRVRAERRDDGMVNLIFEHYRNPDLRQALADVAYLERRLTESMNQYDVLSKAIADVATGIGGKASVSF